jgi:hypothetical protein
LAEVAGHMVDEAVRRARPTQPDLAPTAKSTHGRTVAARCDARRLESGETVNATGPGSRRAFPIVQATRLFGNGRFDPRSGAPSGAVPS